MFIGVIPSEFIPKSGEPLPSKPGVHGLSGSDPLRSNSSEVDIGGTDCGDDEGWIPGDNGGLVFTLRCWLLVVLSVFLEESRAFSPHSKVHIEWQPQHIRLYQ